MAKLTIKKHLPSHPIPKPKHTGIKCFKAELIQDNHFEDTFASDSFYKEQKFMPYIGFGISFPKKSFAPADVSPKKWTQGMVRLLVLGLAVLQTGQGIYNPA